MGKLLTLFIMFFACTARPQTNHPTGATTNAAKPTLTLAQLKIADIQRVNEFWKIERDHVREETRISLKTPMIGLDDYSSIKLDIICYTSANAPVPDDFTFHFVSTA